MIDLDRIKDNVNIENIYRTVTDLEGPRYPLDNMKALNDAGDYILEKLKSFGIKTEVQEFYVAGMKEPFRNIIGKIGDMSKPATLLGSHYDTVRNSPGANDNLSGVAVTLEVARLLSQMDNPPTVLILAFSLEEGHPGLINYIDGRLRQQGIMDYSNKITSIRMLEFRRRIRRKVRKQLRETDDSIIKTYGDLYTELEDTLKEDEKQYLCILKEAYNKFITEAEGNWHGSLIGSYEFVKQLEEMSMNVKDVIIFDCLGWMNNDQSKAKPLDLTDEMVGCTSLYKVEKDNVLNNFIGVFGSQHALELLESFLRCCEVEDIDLPYMGIGFPIACNRIRKVMPDVLRSDHAPFWEKGIPGLFVSDMANFRSDYYHTPADTSLYMDFNALKKIAQITLKVLSREM